MHDFVLIMLIDLFGRGTLNSVGFYCKSFAS